MPDKVKLVPLANFGITIDPGRVGMFDAACKTHRVLWEKTGESYVLTLSELSILEDLYRNLSFAFTDVPEDYPNGVTHDQLRMFLERELGSLEV